ncbi:PREDICTED: glutamate--cysteine ligase, chloroplastic-like, partial [Nelumbo nucifera]|uniref:Glutamate--cysteine ligase, chloroplastic-like n=1 Tax=Nelumbo nucifera TaxID=4432 RepID=A0A1U7Z3U2_NELNU
MTLISQPSPSSYIRSEHNVAGNMEDRIVSRGKAYKMKEGWTGSSSLLWSAEKVPRISHLDGLRGKRRYRTIVAASPPTDVAVIVTEPLTKKDLVGYLASGCKAKENWRIGTEQENFGFEIGTLHPIKYEQIKDLLNGLAERFDWDKIMEGDNIIGLKQGRYEIMRKYMPKVGSLGFDVMFRTCTVQ